MHTAIFFMQFLYDRPCSILAYIFYIKNLPFIQFFLGFEIF